MQSEQMTPRSGAGDGAKDRAARRAVTLFPLLVLAAGALGLATPSLFAGWTSGVPYLLGCVMFCMGLT
ncbi:Bile acid:sodium symporter, partial [Streptomyces sp. NRRL F-6602]